MAPPQDPSMISLRVLWRFLCMRSDAIRTVAASKASLPLGFLFVLSAGFAREYDGEYFLAEPYHLLVPLAASLAACFVMVLILHGLLVFRQNPVPNLGRQYVLFLRCFWMTAPLAWLYAVPVERMMSNADATATNLWFLAVVAAWRVAITIRCLSVLYELRASLATIPILTFGALLLAAIPYIIPGPILFIMGGVRSPDSERLIAEAMLGSQVLGYLSLPVLFIACVSMRFSKLKMGLILDPEAIGGLPGGVSSGIKRLTAASFLVWIPILPFTQSEQGLRWQANQLALEGQFEQLARFFEQHPGADFPPYWDPAPRVGFQELEPHPIDALRGLWQAQATEPTLERYAIKLERYLQMRGRFYGAPDDSYENYLSNQSDIFEALDEKYPANRLSEGFRLLLEYSLENRPLPEDHREGIQKFLDS